MEKNYTVLSWRVLDNLSFFFRAIICNYKTVNCVCVLQFSKAFTITSLIQIDLILFRNSKVLHSIEISLRSIILYNMLVFFLSPTTVARCVVCIHIQLFILVIVINFYIIHLFRVFS